MKKENKNNNNGNKKFCRPFTSQVNLEMMLNFHNMQEDILKS